MQLGSLVGGVAVLYSGFKSFSGTHIFLTLWDLAWGYWEMRISIIIAPESF